MSLVGVHWEAPLGKREITIPTFESPSQVPENQAQRTSLFLSRRREIGRMRTGIEDRKIGFQYSASWIFTSLRCLPSALARAGGSMRGLVAGSAAVWVDCAGSKHDTGREAEHMKQGMGRSSEMAAYI